MCLYSKHQAMYFPRCLKTTVAGAGSPNFSHAFRTSASARTCLLRPSQTTLNFQINRTKTSMACSSDNIPFRIGNKRLTRNRQPGPKAMRSGRSRFPRINTGERRPNGLWRILGSISHMIECHHQSFELLALLRVRLPKST